MTKANNAAISVVLIIMIMLSATLGLVVTGETQIKGLMNAAASENGDGGSTLGHPSDLFFAVMPEETAAFDKKADGENPDRLFYYYTVPFAVDIIGMSISITEKIFFVKPFENVVLLE